MKIDWKYGIRHPIFGRSAYGSTPNTAQENGLMLVNFLSGALAGAAFTAIYFSARFALI